MTAPAPSGPDVSELSDMLADQIERVIDALALDGRRQGRSFVAFTPWRQTTERKLWIDIARRAGAWIDFGSGETGDALNLVAATLCDGATGRDAKRQACEWARRFLGLDRALDPAELERRRAQAKDAARKRAQAAARELSEQRRTAQGLWLAAQPLAAGDAGWAYLKARGIDLARLAGSGGRLPRAVRLMPQAAWYEPGTPPGGEPAHVGPALASAMTLADGKFGSLHRIWINPERPGEKADLSPPRKMWPSSEGAAIRLWRGESGLAEKDAAARGVIEDVVVCEGVEDGLSIALMTPELRVTAAGSLPGLLSWVPPKHARRVIVAADNDWGKPQAKAMLDRACARLATEFKKSVSIARSPEGKDFNDLLRGGA